MIAKIVKGQDFRGVVNYVLNPEKQAEILQSDGLRTRDEQSIIESFRVQAGMNPKVKRAVGHISLDFSPKDRPVLTNEKMTQIAAEYMKAMGIENTQALLVRHYDKEHPHVHLVFNRVDNDGKTIPDKNDRYRSEKICKELTQRFGLYFAPGKEQVNTHRLKEPDKTRYAIYEQVKKALGESRNWDELLEKLKMQDVEVVFKFKGKTTEVQGVIFSQNGYSFSGSKIDRQFSFSKITARLESNQIRSTQEQGIQGKNNLQQSSAFGSYLGGLIRAAEKQRNWENRKEQKLPVKPVKRRKGPKM